MEIVNQLVSTAVSIMSSYGLFVGIILIIIESIIPALPLSVFIALNVASYGAFLGIIISWIATVIGCMLSFILFRSVFQKKLYKFLKKKNLKKIETMIAELSKISFSNLVILIAIPFSPAFLINIAGGLSKITYKKFLTALFIGKLIMVYFWGYIGTSLLESLTDVTVLIKIVLMLVVALIVSKLVEKEFKIK